jgi:hypothetical protein
MTVNYSKFEEDATQTNVHLSWRASEDRDGQFINMGKTIS